MFPQNTDKEKHLFKLLQTTYINTRYKEDYTIRTDELEILRERVNRMYEILKHGISINKLQ
ncbi:MAG: hypothetical protein WKG06_14510 [Segetibacter sp.]